MKHQHLPRAAAGFTLMELLIAMTLGLFLLAGIGTIVVSLRTNLDVQDKLNQMQEDERLLFLVLEKTIQDAGFYSDPINQTLQSSLPQMATANPDGTIFAAGQRISGTLAANSTVSDTLNLRFQSTSGDTIVTCAGDRNKSGGTVVWINSFSVNPSHQLTCAVSTNGGSFGTPVVLVDKVASMQFLYGVDTDGDGNIDTYLNAAGVTGGSYWQSVRSVKLFLNMQDVTNPQATGPANLPPTIVHTINLFNQS